MDDTVEFGLGATIRSFLPIQRDDFAERIAVWVKEVQTDTRRVSGIPNLESANDWCVEGVDAGLDFWVFGYRFEE